MKSFEDLSQQSWYLVSTTLKLKHKFQPAYQCELSPDLLVLLHHHHIWRCNSIAFITSHNIIFAVCVLFYGKCKGKKLREHTSTLDLLVPFRNAPIRQHQSQNFVGYNTFLGQVCRPESSGCLLQCNMQRNLLVWSFL